MGLVAAAWLAGSVHFSAASAAQPATSGRLVAPSSLLSIDQNRATVVDRIVGEWGDALASANGGLSREQLLTLLLGLRADHLLAASLAASLDGLRSVIANAITANAPAEADTVSVKVLGDTAIAAATVTGKALTTISENGGTNATSGVVNGASNAELRWLTVEATFASSFPVAIYNDNALPRITQQVAPLHRALPKGCTRAVRSSRVDGIAGAPANDYATSP